MTRGLNVWAVALLMPAVALATAIADAKDASGAPKEEATRSKVLSPVRAANEREFRALKSNLGITDPDISRVEALELISVAYGKVLDKLDERIRKLESRTDQLERDVVRLKSDTDALKVQTSAMDGDISKLFSWSNDIDRELHDASYRNGVMYKMQQVRQDLGRVIDGHDRAIGRNADNISTLSVGVERNASDIRTLSSMVQALR